MRGLFRQASRAKTRAAPMTEFSTDNAAPGPVAPGPETSHSLDCDDATFRLIPELVARYGDVVRVAADNLKRPAWIITNPRDIRHVLIGNHRNYVKGVGFERVEMLLGNGIIVSDGAFWRRQRTMIQPAFSRANMPHYFEMIRAATERLAERWSALAAAEKSIDLTREISDYALEVILRAIFSDDLDFFTDQTGINPFTFLTDDLSRDLRVAMKFRQLLKQVRVLIERRRETGERPFDLLSTMMDARASKTGEAMSDRELVDEVATMIIAGHETSAGTLNWAWYLLADDEASAASIRSESAAVRAGGPLTYEQLGELSFTRQVIDETLRLYPPVWLYTRRAVAEDSLGGYPIDAGDNIFLCPYQVQRMARYWPEPQRFMPERWAPEAKEQQQEYTFFPFSAGPRRCIGEYFSYVEMRTHLALMTPRFRLHRTSEDPVELEPAINLRSRHNLIMTIEAIAP